MQCEEIENLLDEEVFGQLTPTQKELLTQHIHSCRACKNIYEELGKLSLMMNDDALVVPPEKLKFFFETELESAIRYSNGTKKSLVVSFFQKTALKYAVAAIFFIVTGFGAGYFLGKNTGNTNVPIAQLNKKVTAMQNELFEMKKLTVLNLLKEESAGERLRAVNYVDVLILPDTTLINALVKTMNEDESVHVRIAAASCLENFSNQSFVINALLQSLASQREPMVQIVLMHILTRKNERRALKLIEEIQNGNETDVEVKKVAEKSIAILS